jgi:hypothetical protein
VKRTKFTKKQPFRKGQTVKDIKSGDVLGIVDEVKFGFFTVFRRGHREKDEAKLEISRVRTALASVENDVVLINKEALR